MDWSWCDAVWICTTDKNEKLEKFRKTLETLQLLEVPQTKIIKNVMKHGSHKNPEYSCTANHITVWKRASAANHKRILIVEDDLRLAPIANVKRANRCLQKFMKENSNEWDILYLGCFAQNVKKNRKRYSIDNDVVCWALHAYIVNENFLKKFSHYTPEDMTKEGDFLLKTRGSLQDKAIHRSFPIVNIDGWLALLAQNKKVKAYSMYPQIASQSSRPLTNFYTFSLEPLLPATGNAWHALIFFVLIFLFILLFFVGILVALANKK